MCARHLCSSAADSSTVQCHFLSLSEEIYNAEERAALEAKFQKIHILVVDIWHQTLERAPWPANWHLIPFNVRSRYCVVR